MRLIPVFFLFFLVSCSSIAFDDVHYVMDGPNHNLRAHETKDDLPLSACDPVEVSSGVLEYKCVVHFYPEYQKLLEEIDRLQKELKSCQGG